MTLLPYCHDASSSLSRRLLLVLFLVLFVSLLCQFTKDSVRHTLLHYLSSLSYWLLLMCGIYLGLCSIDFTYFQNVFHCPYLHGSSLVKHNLNYLKIDNKF